MHTRARGSRKQMPKISVSVSLFPEKVTFSREKVTFSREKVVFTILKVTFSALKVILLHINMRINIQGVET